MTEPAPTALPLTREQSVANFRAALNTVLTHREDYAAQRAAFTWPRLGLFNWADDVFRPLAQSTPDAPALIWDTGRWTYGELEDRANRVGRVLQGGGVRPGERVLLMVGGVPDLWAVLIACIRIGAVVIPATTLLSPEDLQDRLSRGEVRHVVTEAGETPKFAGLSGFTRFVLGRPAPDWTAPGWTDLQGEAEGAPGGRSRGTRPSRRTRCCCTSRAAPPAARNS